jgi:DNA-binding response OmpR family regulator
MTSHYSILVIDDDDNLRHTLVIILENAGLSVTPAATGHDALCKLKQLSFDLILLDFDLLDASGRALLGVLRQLYSRTPVVVLTGQSYPNLAVELQQLGTRGCLSKPVDPECILTRVLAMLRERLIPDSAADVSPGSKSLNGSEMIVEKGRELPESGETTTPSQTVEGTIS